MKKFVLLFFAIGLLASAKAQTDTLPSKDLFDMSLEELMDLEVTSASKFAQKASEAPAMVYVVTSQQIQDRNYFSLQDLLEDIPQVEIMKNAHTQVNNHISINGIAGNEKFVVLVDGVRNTSTSGNNHTIGESYTLENVRQVEIILGPASSLYGADAFTGIINIRTFAPSDHKGIRLQSSYGMYNTVRNSLLLSATKGQVEFSVLGKYFSSDQATLPDYYPADYKGYFDYRATGRMNLFGQTVEPAIGNVPWATPIRSYAAMAKLRYKGFDFSYNLFNERVNSSIGAKPAETIFEKDAFFDITIQNLAGVYTHNATDRMQLVTYLTGQTYRVDPHSAYNNLYSGYEHVYKYKDDWSVKAEQQLNYQFSEQTNLVAGLSFEHIDAQPKSSDLPEPYDTSIKVEDQRVPYPGTQFVDIDGNDLTIYQDFYHIKYQNYGAYAQFRTQLVDGLDFTVGTRYDYNSRYGSTINPRAGLVYKPISKLTLKFLYGHAYLAPAPDKAFQHYGSFFPITNAQGGVIGLGSSYWYLTNPDLKPEKRLSADGVVQYQINSDWAISLNGYYGEVTDLIQSTGAPGQSFKGVAVGWVDRPYNFGKTIAFGGTARVDFKKAVSENITIDWFGAYALSDGQIEQNPLVLSSKHTIKSGLNIDFNQRFNLFTRFEYRSGAHFQASTEATPLISDAYSVLSATANFKFSFGDRAKASLFTKVTNLTDARYYHPGTQSHVFVPQSPILAELGLKFAY